MNSKIIKIICLFYLICLTPPLGAAQRKAEQAFLPRVGVIKNDQPRGTDIEGCDRHLLSFRQDDNELFFESHPNGHDAWINLDGRNVQLNLQKTTLYHKGDFGEANAVYEYRYKKIGVIVRMPFLYDYTSYLPATVEIRKGKARKTIKAFALPQCDAI